MAQLGLPLGKCVLEVPQLALVTDGGQAGSGAAHVCPTPSSRAADEHRHRAPVAKAAEQERCIHSGLTAWAVQHRDQGLKSIGWALSGELPNRAPALPGLTAFEPADEDHCIRAERRRPEVQSISSNPIQELDQPGSKISVAGSSGGSEI